MQKPLYKKEETPDFRNPAVQNTFLEETKTSKELLLKELDLNREEQNLLQKRIAIMNHFINDIPASDPQYGMMVVQARMDQIEIDELRLRESAIIEQIQIMT